MEEIRLCEKKCGYTMKPICPHCSGSTGSSQPPKFSLDDKYAAYRREVRRSGLTMRGLY